MKLVLHSFEEVLDDIQRFEGASVKLPFEMLAKSKFLKLYSECHSARLPSTRTANDLVQRIEHWLGDTTVHLINPDVVPEIIENGNDRWMYGLDREAHTSTLLLTYREQSNDDSLDKLFSSPEFSKWKTLLNVHVDLGTMSQLNLSRVNH